MSAATTHWSRAALQVGACGRVRCEPGWTLDETWSRRLQDHDLWLVWAGHGRMQLADGELALRPGVCVWMRPGGRYLATQDPVDRLGVTYAHFQLGELPAAPRLPREAHPTVDLALFDAVTRRIVALQHAQPPAAELAAVYLRGLLLELERADAWPTGPAGGTPRQHHAVAQAAAARLRENPGQAPTLAALAREAGYSDDYFARVFRRVIGVGPEEYRVQCRVNRGKQLLAETGLTVEQVAAALGYCDVYFFSRQFKHRTGRSPTAHRRALAATATGRRDFPGVGVGTK